MTLQKPPPPIRSKAHVAFVASLPCCITGRIGGTHAHHLLRGTGEKAMGRRAGDNWTIPLHYKTHDALHKDGDETGFLEWHHIDGPALARSLYAASGDHEQGCRVLRELDNLHYRRKKARATAT